MTHSTTDPFRRRVKRQTRQIKRLYIALSGVSFQETSLYHCPPFADLKSQFFAERQLPENAPISATLLQDWACFYLEQAGFQLVEKR